ncbi:MAG: hypothetical protein QNJ38_01310 [Prochloraceae cyanobacterium]|nr:hypothetical protein [Prochloraceae cyanobacterium]
MGKFNHLLFPIAANLATIYSNATTADLFTVDSGQNFLRVPFNDFGGYSPIWEGNANQPIQGAANFFVRTTPRRYGFQITTNDGRFVIYEVLSQLVAIAQQDPTVYKPIVVRDYMNPIHEPINQPYSERSGIINDLLPAGGTITFNSETIVSKGTKFKFIEKILRFA